MTAAHASERRLILISAATAQRRALLAGHARPLLGQVDWARMLLTLRNRRLIATLGPRLLGLGGACPNQVFAAAVDQSLRDARSHGQLLELLAERMTASLAEAGIPAAVLKGPTLARALYGDLGRRVCQDLDLLVAPQQLGAAVEVVRRLGYSDPRDPTDRRGLPRLHFAMEHAGAALPAVELHWRIHWYEEAFAAERLLPDAGAPPGSWRPGRAAELAALLLFYARDGFIGLRMASDIATWWDRNGELLERDGLAPIMRAYPALAPVLRGAVAAAERVVGLPAGELLAGAGSARVWVAARLGDPHPESSAAQVYAQMGLIDGLLSPPGGLSAFLRRQLLLPREVFDHRARRAPPRAARSRLTHIALVLIRCGVLARYALALTRIPRRAWSVAR